MKKIIFGSILVCLLAIWGAPFTNGLMMEKVVKSTLEDFAEQNRMAGSDLSIEIIDYKRRFSSSRIEWKIDLGKLTAVDGIDEILIIDQAKHGYTGVVSKSTFKKNKWYADMVDNHLNGQDPLEVTTHYSLLGKIASTVVLNAFSFQNHEDVVEVKPGKIVVECGRGFKTISSQGRCEGITVQDKFRMDGLSFSSNLEMISDYIWDGGGTLSVKNSNAKAGEAPFEVSNLKADYSMTFDKDDNTISIGMGYGADSLVVEKNKIDNASMRIGINNVDAKGYEELMALYTKTVNTAMSGMADAQKDPEHAEALLQQQLAANSMQFMAAFENMLKNGLEIQVSNLSAKLPEGEIKGDLALRLKQDMTMAKFFPIIGQPKLALGLFSLQSDLSLPAELVGDNPSLLSPVYPGMQTGLFTKQGPQMVHTAETKDGKLFLNGQEVLFN